MVIIKIGTILTALFAVFAFFVFGPFYNSPIWQLTLAAVLLLLSLLRHGVRTTLRSLWFVTPFVLSLLVFGAIFQWWQLLGRTDWLQDSLLKAVVFPNSFLSVKLGLESITFHDLAGLPLRPRARRTVFILKTVMEKCTPLLHRYRFFMDLDPHFRGRRGERLLRLCGAIVATYISIYQQTEKTRDLYDHRRRYLEKNL